MNLYLCLFKLILINQYTSIRFCQIIRFLSDYPMKGFSSQRYLCLRLNKSRDIRNAVYYHNNSNKCNNHNLSSNSAYLFYPNSTNNSAHSRLNFLIRFRNNSLYSTAIHLLAHNLQLFYCFALSLLDWQSLSKQLKFYFNYDPNMRKSPPYICFLNLELKSTVVYTILEYSITY